MLINSTADIKEYYGTLAGNTSFKTLKPFVTQAQAKYLLPFVGGELLAELEAGIVPVSNELSQVTLTGKAKDLYELLANSLAYYSVLDAMPFLNLSMGNNGIQEQNIPNHTPTRQWSFFLAENAAANNADTFVDLALEYLERNAADFESWRNSTLFSVHSGLFISSTAELSRYLNIQGSRRAYLALRPYLERAEQLYILPELGSDLYERLKIEKELTAEELRLIALIKPALAQLALKEAIPELCLQITGAGFKVMAENDSIRSRLAASDTQVAALEIKAINLANVYLADLRRSLDTYLQVGETTPMTNLQTWQPPDNSNSQAFWV